MASVKVDGNFRVDWFSCSLKRIWEEFLHMNVEVSDNHIFKRLYIDLIDHIWTLACHKENEE
jgi:hypothetical protein